MLNGWVAAGSESNCGCRWQAADKSAILASLTLGQGLNYKTFIVREFAKLLRRDIACAEKTRFC